MIESKTFEYAPKFLARRYPIFAELEDNPIYLRESGKRYAGPRRSFWSLAPPSGNFLLNLLRWPAFIVASLLLLGFIGLGLACCFPLTLPLSLVLIHHLFNSPFLLGGSLRSRLNAEWQAGQLEHLYLSSITGRQLVWGYACARFGKCAWWFSSLIIVFGSLIGFFIIFIQIIDNSYYSAYSTQRIVMTIAITVMIILTLLLQGTIFLFLSILISASRSIDRLGTPLNERMNKGIVAILKDTLVCAGLTVPGVLVNIVLWLALTFLVFLPAGGFIYQYERAWELLFPIISLAVYNCVNLPLCWLAIRKVYEVSMKRVNQDFALAVRRLGERREAAAGSAIFGE